ncbi:ribosome maturation factor RimM [Zhihengliuella salsuginis]|uniref:Ribosome maturation factor RimM n=1 Tax=Zhihengliuella salsuginis TaxID=578222 RepID=A0ABQ3GLS5_9MICC|nr:ribosome maturation factor RimM [Zhihengliuella salsuginis]GHD11873.1 ribosome maturation factor RimM [Zhihengliuella salsuginis]
MRLQVARIGKPHGIRGEVTVQVMTDAPEERFVPGQVLDVEPESAGPLTVARARWNKEILLLGFEEVKDRNGAEALRGSQLFVETDEEEPVDDDAWYAHELVGLAAVVEGQAIGTVSGLRRGDAQDLLEIELTGGGDVLVPFVEEIVPEVDLEAEQVILTPPAGLLELNQPEDPEAGR